jgi:hypothetical protein
MKNDYSLIRSAIRSACKIIESSSLCDDTYLSRANKDAILDGAKIDTSIGEGASYIYVEFRVRENTNFDTTCTLSIKYDYDWNHDMVADGNYYKTFKLDVGVNYTGYSTTEVSIVRTRMAFIEKIISVGEKIKCELPKSITIMVKTAEEIAEDRKRFADEEAEQQCEIVLNDLVNANRKCMRVGGKAVAIHDERLEAVEDRAYEIDMDNKRYEIAVYKSSAALTRIS